MNKVISQSVCEPMSPREESLNLGDKDYKENVSRTNTNTVVEDEY